MTLRLWVGLHGPPGLPGTVVQKLNDAIGKALAAPDLRERFAAMVRQHVETLARTMDAAGIKAE